MQVSSRALISLVGGTLGGLTCADNRISQIGKGCAKFVVLDRLIDKQAAGFGAASRWSASPTGPNGFLADPRLCSERSRGRPHAPYCGLRLLFPRPSSGFFAVAEIPAARSFAIRLMSFTGAGLVSGNWTLPFAAYIR